MAGLVNLRSLFGLDRTNIKNRFEFLSSPIEGTTCKFFTVRDKSSKKIFGLKIIDRAKTQSIRNRFKDLKFPKEGEIAKNISGSFVVRTLEIGITSEDQEYLLMERLEGPRVDLIVNSESLKLETRCSMALQMAQGLKSVHDAGYLHRDICPKNFVCDKEVKNCKLIDFGLAVPDTPDFHKRISRAASPLFMAPELVRRRNVDKKIDIFAFGISAYQLITGQHPWGVTEAESKVTLRFDTSEPTPILDLAPRLPKSFAKAVHSCLVADPEKRVASMKNFLIATK